MTEERKPSQYAFFASYALHVPGHDFSTFGTMQVLVPFDQISGLVAARMVEEQILSELVSGSGYPKDTVVSLLNWNRLPDDDIYGDAQPTAEIREFKKRK